MSALERMEDFFGLLCVAVPSSRMCYLSSFDVLFAAFRNDLPMNKVPSVVVTDSFSYDLSCTEDTNDGDRIGHTIGNVSLVSRCCFLWHLLRITSTEVS